MSIDQLLAAFTKKDTTESTPNNFYPFWNMKEGEHCVIRFLPDKNEENPLGLTLETHVHILEINGAYKQVPCLNKMFKEDCPICNVSSAYYADEGKDSINGKKYWAKKEHIFQALIIEDPLDPNPETGENDEGKVKLLKFKFQLYNAFKEGLSSGELEAMPTLYKGGCNFIIKKSMVGGYAKYDVGSNFARRSTDLTEEQIAVAEQHRVDLSTVLPKKPTFETVSSMLEASLTGNAYVDNSDTTSDTPTTTSTTTSTPIVDVSKPATDVVVDKTEEFNDESNDILAMIRNRKAKAAE